MFSSVFSRFSACRSALVKLLSGGEADCIAEATLLLMLSLVDSDNHKSQSQIQYLGYSVKCCSAFDISILVTIYNLW